MRLPKPFTKDIFIRLDNDDAFTSTVKYGCFYSKTKQFSVETETPARAPAQTAVPAETRVVLPQRLPPKSQGA